MGRSDLAGQFEREVRSLYPEGRATEAERTLLFDLARAKGLSSVEAQLVVERCLGPSTSHTRFPQDPEDPSGRGAGQTPSGAGAETRDTYELSSVPEMKVPTPESAVTRAETAAGRGGTDRHKTTVILRAPADAEAGRPPAASRQRRQPDVQREAQPAEMEANWPASHLVIVGVALVVLVMVLLLIWQIAR